MKYLFGFLLLTSSFLSASSQVKTVCTSIIPVPTVSFQTGYGSVFSQDLGVTPADLQFKPLDHPVDGVYVLEFTIQNLSGSYPGYYDMEVSFGSQELCSIDGWGLQTAQKITVTCLGPGGFNAQSVIFTPQSLTTGGPSQFNDDFMLTVKGLGWGLQFSNISFTFTPVN